MNEGLIVKPMSPDSFDMDACVDSDFPGLHGKEDRGDPDNVKSRTGHVIFVNDCPIVWKSVPQESMSLSAMMAEHCALSTAMRDVMPLRTLIEVVAEGCGADEACLTAFETAAWEDNNGALTLANLDPGQHASRSKFCDSKIHWFRSFSQPDEHGNPSPIKVLKVDTKQQIADLFTECLPTDVFRHSRKLLVGW